MQYEEGVRGKTNKVTLATTVELQDALNAGKTGKKVSETILDGEIAAAKALNTWCGKYKPTQSAKRKPDDKRNIPVDKYGGWNHYFEPVDEHLKPMCNCQGSFPVTVYGQVR